jgi:signal transduction histidine kinase/CHASE3 domain sensor protein
LTKSLRNRTIAVAAVLVLVVAGVMVTLLVAINRQRDSANQARHSQQVISAASQTDTALLAVQTTLRGYLVSAGANLLPTYDKVRADLPETTRRLQILVSDNPDQLQRAEAIRDDALAYVAEYSDPAMTTTREHGVGAGRAFARVQQGSAQATSLQKRIAGLLAAEESLSRARQAAAESASHRAVLIAIVGLAGCILLLSLGSFYVTRAVVFPVRRLAGAADRVRQGDLHVEVPVSRGDEVGELGEAFNAMARALEQSRGELESQNAELEMQAIELEERQADLTDANHEVRAQRDELERTASQLAEEKRRAELYGEFADRLAAEGRSEKLAKIVLLRLAEAAGADVGVLYAANWREEGRWSRTAVHGLDPAVLPETTMVGGEGAAAQAVMRDGVVEIGHDAAALRVRTLAGETAVHWELHVGLRHGERAIGVATLGGVTQTAFDASETAAIRRLAAQAAVALSEAGAYEQRRWLAQINTVVLDSVREGIALVGLDHELVFANTAMETLAARLAMPITQAIGARGADLETAAVDRDAYFAQWEDIFAGNEEPTSDELEISDPPMVLERYTAPVDDLDGARIGRLVVLRDVTRERQAERLKSDLMATVSHELRTPLASVLGYAELLRTRDLPPATREEILGTVHTEAKRLSSLIDDFLDLQTIEQDRLVLASEPFSVYDLLAEQVRAFSGQSADHEMQLASTPDGTLALGDRARIAQVVANLLSNAIKYSPSGGLVRVEVERRDAAGQVVVSVSDQGVGIPVAEQSHVFEKFFRVQRSDLRVGGTGLGLALAHEIIVAHSGRMGFESVEGQGSRFWFALPSA